MKRIPVWKNVVLILSAIVAIVIATFAWFYTGPRASVEELVIHLGDARYIQISGDSGDNWSSELNKEIGIKDTFKEISGNGSVFYAPVYGLDNNYAMEIQAFRLVTGNEHIHEEILDFRGDVVQNVYLDPNSCVVAVDYEGSEDPEAEQRKSYIDGAIRVAFFELDENGEETLKCIWAPNSKVEYSYESDSFNRDGTVEPYYCYQTSETVVNPSTLNSSNSHVAKIYTTGTDEAGCGYNPGYKFMWSNGQGLPHNAPSLLTVDVSGEDDLYYKRMKVRVWLEGHDRECVSLLSGQKFTVKLQFTSQEGE